jgi:Rad/Gem-related GTP binding protein 1
MTSFKDDHFNFQVNDSDDVDDFVESPIKFRVCILGHTGTGKTSLVNQFLTSEYMNAYDTSLG